jgi:hypothetical protein
MGQVIGEWSCCVERQGCAFQDLPDHEVEALVESLNSLNEGELGVAMLVACGAKAVQPLRRFLLQGKPSGIVVPRQRAVRALAELGAKDVLLAYLVFERHINDPVAAHGEDGVKNTAARALAGWRTEDVYEALLGALRKRRLPGLIETIGEFERAEAVPDLMSSLEDDSCRSAAEEALGKMGEVARSALIDAVRTPDPSGRNESASSRSRRRCALRLLQRLRLSPNDWKRLAALPRDSDAEIAARASSIALAVADESGKQFAISRLIEVLPAADWLVQGEIESWLEEYFDVAQASIDAEIEKRRAVSVVAQAKDDILRMLLAIKSKPRRIEADEG